MKTAERERSVSGLKFTGHKKDDRGGISTTAELLWKTFTFKDMLYVYINQLIL
jgi:hypothetical protein